MNEEIAKKQIGELLLSIGEGKFSEKAKEVLKYQFHAGYKYKEEKIKKEKDLVKESKLSQIKKLLDEKSDFFDNEVISELLREIYWKLEHEIYADEEVSKENKKS